LRLASDFKITSAHNLTLPMTISEASFLRGLISTGSSYKLLKSVEKKRSSKSISEDPIKVSIKVLLSQTSILNVVFPGIMI